MWKNQLWQVIQINSKMLVAFKKKITLFIYWLCGAMLPCGLFLSCGEQGLLFIAALSLLIAVSSWVVSGLQWSQFRALEHRLTSRARAQLLHGMWDLPSWGSNLCLPRWQQIHHWATGKAPQCVFTSSTRWFTVSSYRFIQNSCIWVLLS